MRHIVRWVYFLVFVTIFAGCASAPQRLATPSGNPEIVIPNTTRKQVIDKIVAAKLEKGMQIKNVSDYGVVIGTRVNDSFMASLLYGSRYDSTPEARITYNIVETREGVRVFSRAEMVTNPGSAYERISDITQNLLGEMQGELEQLKAYFAK
jgi:hypothetical protein